jgi:hypothetical protein
MKKAIRTWIVTILLILGLGCGHIPAPGERVLTPTTTPLHRFHVNFNIVKALPTWQLVREIIYTAKDREYRFTRDELQNSHVRVVFNECDSMAAAHENILMALMKISSPAPEKERPNGFDFGDIYSRGYWARDNIYIYVHDMSNPKLSTNEIMQFQKAIDNALCTVPEVTRDDVPGKPVINTFEITKKKVALGSDTPLKVIVDNSGEAIPVLRYTFFCEGGRLYKAGNLYYYQAEAEGRHTLKLYVTNKPGLTAMAQLEVQIEK